MFFIVFTRPIYLNKDYCVNDYEFMEIHQYKYNMIHYLRKLILSTCSECKKIFNQDEMFMFIL